MKTKAMFGMIAVAFLSLVLFSPAAFSTAEMGKKEGKPCTACHEKAGDKTLNKVGTCYKEKKSLDQCK